MADFPIVDLTIVGTFMASFFSRLYLMLEPSLLSALPFDNLETRDLPFAELPRPVTWLLILMLEGGPLETDDCISDLI